MNDEKIFQLIDRILAVILPDEMDIAEHAELIELGLNSLNFIQIIVDLEEELDIVFLDEDLLIERFSTKYKIFEKISWTLKNNGNDEKV